MTSDIEVVTPSAKEVVFELLKRKLDEATGLLTHFLRAFAIFLAIIGNREIGDVGSKAH